MPDLVDTTSTQPWAREEGAPLPQVLHGRYVRWEGIVTALIVGALTAVIRQEAKVALWLFKFQDNLPWWNGRGSKPDCTGRASKFSFLGHFIVPAMQRYNLKSIQGLGKVFGSQFY